MRINTVTSKITTMAEANQDTLISQAVLPLTSTEPPRQFTREELEKTRKSELQTLGREIGLNNVWMRKDKLIKMILEMSQPDPAPDTVNLATTASTTRTTNNINTSSSLDHHSASLPHHPDHTAQPIPSKEQQILDQTTCLLRLDTAPELSPDDDAPRSPVNRQNTQPQPQDTSNPNEVTLDHSREEYGQQQCTTNDSRLANPASDAHEDMTDIHAIAREVKNIMDNYKLKDMEIELLTEEIKMAYQLIATLQQRVAALEQRNITSNEEHRQLQTDAPPVPHCLLLGDSNLRRVLSSDLGDKCSVKTIYGANIDSIRRWIQDHFNKAPTECVLYCGISDVLEESPHEIILDNMGALVSDLKEKNCSMKIFVCQIVPPNVSQDLKESIEYFNDHLLKWGETNGINILKITQNFKLGTGELDDLCFENDASGEVFSRIGIIRLLDTVANQCSEFKLCKNWKQVKKSLVNFSLLKPTSAPASLPSAGPLPPPRTAGHGSSSAPSSGAAALGSASSGRGVTQISLPDAAGPRAATTTRGTTLRPPPRPAGSRAASPYLSPPAGHNVTAYAPRGPAGPRAAPSHSPHPLGYNEPPPPPKPTSDAAPPATASYYPPYSYVTLPAATHYYQQTNEDVPGSSLYPYGQLGDTGSVINTLPCTAAWGGARVWGSNAARHSPPSQESGRTAPHYPEGPRRAWQPRRAFRGVPPAVHTMQWGQQVPHTGGASHATSSGWSWTGNYTPGMGPVSYHNTSINAHPALRTTTRKGKRRGCYNCGEFNHQKENCRFDHMLRCGLCNHLGHKQRLCHYYGI